MIRRVCTVGAVIGLAVACSGHTQHTQPTPPALTVGGQTTHTYTGQGPKVVILGDSLTVRSWNETYNDLTNDRAVMVAAWEGESYDGGPLSTRLGGLLLPQAAKTYATTHPDVAVLALGTNNVWVATRDIHGALLAMAAMVNELKPACLVGVTIPETSVLRNWNGTNARVLNDAMRGWADQIVDWARISQEPGVTDPDHVHPTKLGAERRASAVASAVRSCKSS